MICLQSWRPWFDSWVGKFPSRRNTPVFLGFPGGSDGKESACNVGDLGLVPGLGRSPGGGHGNPLQYSCLEYPHGQRSLADYSPWSHIELDTTEQLRIAQCVYVNSKLLIYPSLGILIYKDFPSNTAIRITKILKTYDINGKFLQAEVNLYCFKLIYWGFSHKMSKQFYSHGFEIKKKSFRNKRN